MSITTVLNQEVKVNEGCEVTQGLDYSLSKQGVASTLAWKVTHPQTGDPVILDDAVKAVVNLRTTAENDQDISRVFGTIVSPSSNIVSFVLPEKIHSKAGVYSIDIGLYDQDHGTEVKDYIKIYPQAVQSGYHLVERTSFANGTDKHSAVPRVEEIRNLINDYPDTNTLLRQYEFSISDIINAIMQPVLEWNETPPYLSHYYFDCCSFPYRYEWMHATVAYLLKTAIHKYMRNKLLTSHAGVGGDDLNRNAEYERTYQQLSQEWQQWRHRAKYALNINQFVGRMNSSLYSFFPGDRVVTHPRTM